MPSNLVPINKINPETLKNNLVLNLPLILSFSALAYLFYVFVFQLFNFALATFLGGLFSYYFIQFKIKAQHKAEHTLFLSKLTYFIQKSIQCNETFYTHRISQTNNPIAPWESLLNFYDFHFLPTLNIENHIFLLKRDTDYQLLEAIINFRTQVMTLSKAVDELQNYHCVYLDKMNIWESKIKTQKGLREMHNIDLKGLKERIGENLLNRLSFLTNIILENTSSLNEKGTKLINLVRTYEKKL